MLTGEEVKLAHKTLVTVHYKAPDVEVTYDRHLDGYVEFKADRMCVLHFPATSDFGVDTLVLEENVTKGLKLPDPFNPPSLIEFSVFSLAVPSPHSGSEPPPIRP